MDVASDVAGIGMELCETKLAEECIDKVGDVVEGVTGVPLILVFGVAGSVVGLIHEIYVANKDLDGVFSRLENTCKAVQACTKECREGNPRIGEIFEVINLRLEDAYALLSGLAAKRNRALFGVLVKAPKYVAEANELAAALEGLLSTLRTLLEVDAPLHASAAKVITDDYALRFWSEKVGADKTYVAYPVFVGGLTDYCRDVGKPADGLRAGGTPASPEVSVFAFTTAIAIAGGWEPFLNLLATANPFSVEYARDARRCAAAACERRKGGFYHAKAGMPRTRADKKYFYICSGAGLVLEPYGESYAIERYVAGVRPTGSPFQQWYLSKQGLVCNRETGLALGFVGAPQKGKWLVQLPKVQSCPALAWLFLEDGTIAPAADPDLVVDIDLKGRSADKVVMLYPRNGAPNQTFTLCNFVEAAEPPSVTATSNSKEERKSAKAL